MPRDDVEYRSCPFPKGETDTHINCPDLQIVLVGANRRPMVFLGVVSYVPPMSNSLVLSATKVGDYVLANPKIHGYDPHGLRFSIPGRVYIKPRRES